MKTIILTLLTLVLFSCVSEKDRKLQKLTNSINIEYQYIIHSKYDVDTNILNHKLKIVDSLTNELNIMYKNDLMYESRYNDLMYDLNVTKYMLELNIFLYKKKIEKEMLDSLYNEIITRDL